MWRSARHTSSISNYKNEEGAVETAPTKTKKTAVETAPTETNSASAE